MKKVSVMIVEDSLVVSEFLRHIIENDDRLQLAGVVRSGEEALKALPTLQPDVISLDIRLPGMNGLEVTQKIMTTQPTPIVVVSSDVENEELNISMNALRAGALAVVQKPVGLSHSDYAALASNLCTKLLIMSQVRVIRQRYTSRVLPPRQSNTIIHPIEAAPSILAVVASTGGPSAVEHVLNALGKNFQAPVLLVQHITPEFVAGFVSWLNDVVPHLRVEKAQTGAPLLPGTVYVAPADAHLTCTANRHICLTSGPAVAGQKPSGSVLFSSLAETQGSKAVGVLLTGMGEDGATGLKEMYDRGAFTIAEHESTAVVNGMPGAAVRMGGASAVLPLHEIGRRLKQLFAASYKP